MKPFKNQNAMKSNRIIDPPEE